MTYLAEQNYYEVLEISPNAAQNEIRRAYDRAKATYSQDNEALYSVFTKEEAREFLKLIDEAYTVLGNHELRRAYDEKLKYKGQSVVEPEQVALQSRRIESAVAPPAPAMAVGSASVFDNSAYPSAHGEEKVNPYSIVSSDFTEPSKYGKTQLSQYEINEAFENIINTQEIFDGAFLKRIREYKNVQLDQLSELIRVGKNYLDALEKNDFDNLPAPVFVRGFVVQYAKVMKLNEHRVAKSYMDFMKKTIGN